jgi:hypothetical protein
MEEQKAAASRKPQAASFKQKQGKRRQAAAYKRLTGFRRKTTH